MRKLTLTKGTNYFETTGVAANINKLIKDFGRKFIVSYENKDVPLIIQRRLHTDDDRYVFSIAINTPTTYDMQYHTLHITLGAYDEDLSVAYIETINKNENLGFSGSFIVKFAISLLKTIGVKEIELQDVATIALEGKKQCLTSLSSYLLLKKATTFYGKFGFKPKLANYTNTSYENDNKMHKRLCSIVTKLQSIKVLEVINYLNKVVKLFEQHEIIDFIDFAKDFRVGVDVIIEPIYDVKEKTAATAFITQRVLKVLSKYDTNTFVEFFEQCTCVEYIAVYNFFVKFPSVIVYDKNKTLKNPYKPFLQELNYIQNKVIYSLTLHTRKSSSSTC